jgi:hypothetical protein
MRRSLILVAITLGVVALIGLPAKADTINTFNFSTNLVGSAGTVTGSFTFDSTTNTFTSATLSFSSPIFGDFKISAPKPQDGFLFIFGTTANGNLVFYTILLNPFDLGQFWVNGLISGHGGYSEYNYTPIPEGAEWFLYLIPSAGVMLGAFLLAGKQRRFTLRAAHA